MLRNTHVFRTASLPVPARAGMIGTLALLGLAVAGLRGPTGTPSHAETIKRDRKSGQDGPRQRRLIRPFARAGRDQDAARDAHRPLARARRDQVARSLDAAGLRSSAPFVNPARRNRPVDSLLGRASRGPGPARHRLVRPTPSGIVIHSSKPQDWKNGFAKSFESPPRNSWRPVRHAFGSPSLLCPGWCGFTPDDRTLVLAGEDTLRDLIHDRKGPAPGVPGIKPGTSPARAS